MHDAPVSSSSKYKIPGPAVWKGGDGLAIAGLGSAGLGIAGLGSAGLGSASQERTHALYVESEERNVTDSATE